MFELDASTRAQATIDTAIARCKETGADLLVLWNPATPAYFEALEQRPWEEWSPATRLEFFLNQTQVAEKLLNRVEAPVACTRLDPARDADDLDELSPTGLVQLFAAIVTRQA